MLLKIVVAPLICLLLTTITVAQEHRVEVLDEAPPADKVSENLREQFAASGFKVIRGSSRTVCEFWPCQSWNVSADFKATSERLYPFEPGQLIGLLRFRRRGKDFRAQTISSGVYTLRYGLQPIDGNHEGTSPTRDFLLMVSAEDDKAVEPWDAEKLLEASTSAAGSSHPAMLGLQPSPVGASPQPAMRHNEQNDWWILHFVGKATSRGKTHELPVDLIVAGHAKE